MDLLKVPLSDQDIANALGIFTEDILKYSKLANYKSIQELLPDNTDFKVIFLEWAPNSTGHWVLCYKCDKKYCYFNPYGNAPDKDLNVISRCMKQILGEDTQQFKRLMGGKEMLHSTKRYQKGNVDTCGRWVIFRVHMLKLGYSQPEFDQYMEEVKSKRYPDKSFDEIVCSYVPIKS